MRYTVPNPHRDREVRSALALLRGISDGPSYSPDQQTAVSEELCLPAVLLQVTLLIDQISKSILSMDLELHKFKVNQGYYDFETVSKLEGKTRARSLAPQLRQG